MITQSTPKPFRVECSIVPPLYKCKLCLFHTTPDQKIYRIIKWIWIQFLDRFAFWVPIHISSVHLLADYLAPASVASISLSSVRYDTWHTLKILLKMNHSNENFCNLKQPKCTVDGMPFTNYSTWITWIDKESISRNFRKYIQSFHLLKNYRMEWIKKNANDTHRMAAAATAAARSSCIYIAVEINKKKNCSATYEMIILDGQENAITQFEWAKKTNWQCIESKQN